ncbi:MAG TPA: isopentenyl phosphate kinase [Anaerolineae bacterium]|nr:isopentenyl phosphate kinase [Anaerolineae bacterium]
MKTTAPEGERSGDVETRLTPALSHSQTVFLKLGGSIITDKMQVEHARVDVIQRLAREVRAALDARPDLQLVLGHGSGSFGHVAAKKYGTRDGVQDRAGWIGLAEVAAAAARLNQIVTDIFIEERVPVVSLPPSASARCEDGLLVYLDTQILATHLHNGLAPLVYGDVALDAARGATIVSTEDVFAYLVNEIEPAWVLLAGEVGGVYPNADMTGEVIPLITPDTVERHASALGGSHGVDVTGGMAAKVWQVSEWVRAHPQLSARIFSAGEAGTLQRALLDPAAPIGTLIRADASDEVGRRFPG